MTSAEPVDRGGHDSAARLRELLAELESAAPVRRTDPTAGRQLALCAEVEAILRVRAESRPAARATR